ncbi:hypothetical protein MIND_01398600 [Mycena indigotica]|uniref:Uncharacterized protein n=1 Tax=Mycena indigotica TaxID=2126181 RepID=A0A8H6RZY9_9AGAR|nr:uncharacterized protein MIND_01398600 [Mycena indigotica]KAF7289362.1 hypothetical protein MIND_01398600 [Mycena indigotica]
MASIPIKWSSAAENDIAQMTAAQFGGTDPRVYHEYLVQQYWSSYKTYPSISQATVARLRRGAHVGGSDPNAPDHITVAFEWKREKYTVHIPTGR